MKYSKPNWLPVRNYLITCNYMRIWFVLHIISLLIFENCTPLISSLQSRSNLYTHNHAPRNKPRPSQQTTPLIAGQRCEEETDECLSKPCQNGGSCVDTVNGYTCECTNTYEGPSCSERIDNCISEPCKHGANCTNSGG